MWRTPSFSVFSADAGIPVEKYFGSGHEKRPHTARVMTREIKRIDAFFIVGDKYHRDY